MQAAERRLASLPQSCATEIQGKLLFALCSTFEDNVQCHFTLVVLELSSIKSEDNSPFVFSTEMKCHVSILDDTTWQYDDMKFLNKVNEYI